MSVIYFRNLRHVQYCELFLSFSYPIPKIEIAIEAKSIKTPRLHVPSLFQFFYFLHIHTFIAMAELFHSFLIDLTLRLSHLEGCLARIDLEMAGVVCRGIHR